RIPSNQNPAYQEYCRAMGVQADENDVIVLLSTIGRKGPSSFIFYPIYQHTITSTELLKYRKFLGFTTREFAHVFELTQASLTALERNRVKGTSLFRKLEIILAYPAVALNFLLINGGILVREKFV